MAECKWCGSEIGNPASWSPDSLKGQFLMDACNECEKQHKRFAAAALTAHILAPAILVAAGGIGSDSDTGGEITAETVARAVMRGANAQMAAYAALRKEAGNGK